MSCFCFFVILKSGWEKKSYFRLFFLLAVNFWAFFFFSSQRLLFKEELWLFFFKPYKLPVAEKTIIGSLLGIFFLIIMAAVWQYLSSHQYDKQIIFKVRKNINWKLILFVLAAWLFLNCSGIFIRLSSKDKVNWRGYWIWESGNYEKENLYLIFKKDFNLLFLPSKARIYSLCQSEYRLFVNDNFVGQGGLISNQDIAYYDEWQVEGFLKKGKNNILIECHNPYLNSLTLVRKKGGMIFQFEAEKGFLKRRIVSDSSWQVVVDSHYRPEVVRISGYLGFQQFFDGEHSLDSWQKAEIFEKGSEPILGKMTLRPIPPLELKKTPFVNLIEVGQFRENPKVHSPDLARVIGDGFKVNEMVVKQLPFEVKENQTFLLFDFGKIIVGYPQLALSAKAGTAIDFGFAETLKSDGAPDVAKMVSQADKIVSQPGEFFYRWFQRRAFRYAILIFKDFPEPVTLKEFSVATVNYPTDENESSFDSSDKVLNEIFKVAKYTAKIARQGIIEDCPQRERGQYVGDVRIVSLVNYYNFSDKTLVEKALWDFALSQNGEGFITAISPAGGELFLPDYSAQWISAVWEYYQYVGDRIFLRKIYSYLKKQIEAFANFTDKSGLISSQPKWWVFIDHGDQEKNDGKSISLNIFYLEALRKMALVAEAVDKPADEEEFKRKALRVEESIKKYAWNSKINLYDDCLGEIPCEHFSRQTNTLALEEDLMPNDKIRQTVKRLVSDQSLPMVITPYFNTFVAEALFKNGFGEEALSLLRRYWGGMLARGATTFWETFDPKTGRETAAFGESLAHGWSSGPAYLLPRWVLGVAPLLPGYQRFIVHPFLGNLSFASGKIPVGKDKWIEVSWRRKENVILKLKANFSAEAEVVVSQEKGEKKLVQTPGEFVFEIR